METRGQRFKNFLKSHKWSIILVATAILLSAFLVWYFVYKNNYEGSFLVTKPKPKPKVTTVTAPISGLQVAEEQAKLKPVAIVIENHPDARPQSGLNKAALVYETFAEGGITRFLAVFQENDYKEIGPVRSARPYFVDWASSYRALFAHVGGNIDALDLIPKSNLYDLNQFYNGAYFWRDKKRYAPHNVYTTLEKLRQAAEKRKYPTTDSNVPAFVFKKEIASKNRPAAFSFRVNFNSSFAVTWNYDPKTNSYYRSMLGLAQKDRVSGEQIVAKNVLVGFTDFSYGTTRYNEKSTKIRTTGTGSAIMYIDGTRRLGTWRRVGSNVARFYETDGTEVKLNPGTTWMVFAPTGTTVN